MYARALAVALSLAACTTQAPAPSGPGDAALRRAERECAQGQAAACERAGLRYLRGSGIPRDLARAESFLGRACPERIQACVPLGTARVMQGDAAGGKALYERSCNGGSAEGCYALAELVRAQSPAQAAELLERACGGGFTGACYSLGALLARGDGVAPDRTRAAELFERACTDGDGRACFALAFQLERGAGVARDPERAGKLFADARRFFQERCRDGEGYACHNLALIYAGGLGTEPQPGRAAELLERACKLGSQRSCNVAPGSLSDGDL